MVRVKYLLVEIVLPPTMMIEGLTMFDIYRQLRGQIQSLFGTITASSIASSIQVKYLNLQTNKMIISCLKDSYRMVWAALTFMTKISSIPTTLRVLHVGGTIRSCQSILIDIDQKTALDLLSVAESIDEETILPDDPPSL